MAKKLTLKTGDIFSVKVAENEFIFGRILFDVSKQYLHSPLGNETKNYLDFFSECFLIETFYGVYSDISNVDMEKKAVLSVFVFNNFYKKDFFQNRDFTVVGFKEVDYKKVSFPETLSSYHPNYYFSCGELYIKINIDEHTYYDKIKIMPSAGYGYDEIIVATLDISKREDLIEPGDKMDNYFRWSDLRSVPNIRSDIYTMLGEDPTQSYYEMALKHGFDLARLY
jgi:hypothetical protein